jgi:hypothetical protein
MWETIIQAFLTITLPLFLAIWKGSEYMNKLAEARSRKEREFVEEVSTSVCKTVINELMSTPLEEIRNSLSDIKLEQKKLDDRIDDIYKHLK